MTKGSTSSLRHHIKAKHPADGAKVITAEKEKAERDAANKEEAQRLQEEIEGDPDDLEEDLTQHTPGPSSRKRLADETLGETPKRPRADDKLSPRKSMFTKVGKYNVKNKKQLKLDLRYTEHLISNNYSLESVSSRGNQKWCEWLVPQSYVKHPTTFTRYFITYIFNIINVVKTNFFVIFDINVLKTKIFVIF